MKPKAPPPADEADLLARARDLEGQMLRDLAGSLGWGVPADLRRQKGWAGALLEHALGATAGSRAEPDFPELGVELKSIPTRRDGRPRESTWVCAASLDGLAPERWEDSWPARKLARVLWVPVVGEGRMAPGDRWVGRAVLWSPSPAQRATLAADYATLLELLSSGELQQISARRGRALQLRPKAAHGRHWVWAQDADGDWSLATPLGFYLRASFTAVVLGAEPATRG